MIDDELYQRAAEELDSERRRPHLWARACALAADDHDEARYLYTNLRVEELLEEAGRGGAEGSAATDRPDPAGGEPAGGDRHAGDDLVDDDFAGFELEALPDVGDGRAAPLAAEGDDRTELRPTSPDDRLDDTLDDTLEDAPRPASERGRLAHDLEHDATLDLDSVDVSGTDEPGQDSVRPGGGPDAADRLAPLAAASSGRPDPTPPDDDPHGLDALFATGETMREPSHDDDPLSEPPMFRRAPDAEADGVIEAIDPDETFTDDTIALDRPFRLPGPDLDPLAPDDLERLDEDYRAERRDLVVPASPPSDAGDDGDALVREFRRQAEDWPGDEARGTGVVISHEQPDTLPMRRVGPRADSGSEERSPEEVGAAEHDADAPYAPTDEPLEITDERGGRSEYAVFVDGAGRAQAVRQGSSWGALVATLPWLLYRRLVGTAIVYALFAVAVLCGLAVTAVTWAEAGEAATLVTRGATIGFALLAFAGLVVVPFRSANHWREDKLERRGFDLVAYVRTRDRERAISLARQAKGAAA